MTDYIDELIIDLDANEVTFKNKSGREYTYSRDMIDDSVIFGITDKRSDNTTVYYQGGEYTLEELREANIGVE